MTAVTYNPQKIRCLRADFGSQLTLEGLRDALAGVSLAEVVHLLQHAKYSAEYRRSQDPRGRYRLYLRARVRITGPKGKYRTAGRVSANKLVLNLTVSFLRFSNATITANSKALIAAAQSRAAALNAARADLPALLKLLNAPILPA